MLFYVPFVYVVSSRLPRSADKISWIIINPLALFLVTYFLGDMPLYKHFVFFILGILIWQSIYEIGYIYNDVFTIKNEAKPTIRLGEIESKFGEKRFVSIVVFRVVIAVSLFACIYSIDMYNRSHLHFIHFGGVLCVSCIAFAIHNGIRNRFNIVTFGVLSATKYLALPLLMVSEPKEVVGVLIALTMFPLVRTIEHSTKNKYSIRWLKHMVGDFTLFRVKYYVTTLGFTCLVNWLFGISYAYIFIGIYCYFLVYRIGVLFILRNNLIRQTAYVNY